MKKLLLGVVGLILCTQLLADNLSAQDFAYNMTLYILSSNKSGPVTLAFRNYTLTTHSDAAQQSVVNKVTADS